MSEILFYHLTEHPLERALPSLVERSLARGWRVVVQSGRAERVPVLSELLWTYSPGSFLAHGHAASEGERAADHPIWLTADEDTPNGAKVRFLVDGARCEDLSSFERAVFMFDGHDATAVNDARAEWRARAGTASLTYWKQNENGGWEQAG